MPGDVPEAIEIDITELDIGDLLRVADITPPAGVTFLTDPDTPVISVITPAALRVEADLTRPRRGAGRGRGPEAEAAEEAPAEGEARPAEGGGDAAARGTRRVRGLGTRHRRHGLGHRGAREPRRPLRVDPPQPRPDGRGRTRDPRRRTAAQGPVPARRGGGGRDSATSVAWLATSHPVHERGRAPRTRASRASTGRRPTTSSRCTTRSRSRGGAPAEARRRRARGTTACGP